MTSLQATQHENRNREDAIEKLKEKVAGIRIAMLTTLEQNGRFHSRPMANQQISSDGSFWFFTDDTAPKSREIKNEDRVSLTLSSADEHRFVAVSGRAELVHDKAKMEELWNPLYKTWFPNGLETPRLCLIRVRPEHAEYWDTRLKSMVSLFELGKNEKLDLSA